MAPSTEPDSRSHPNASVFDSTIELRGHLIDTGLIDEVYDLITEAGCTFEVEVFQPGVRRDQSCLPLCGRAGGLWMKNLMQALKSP
jgi:LOR/SDH bifunctional enzyme conserved region